MTYHNLSAPRLCGADFKTPGRCFILEDTPKSWQVAENHCRQKLPFPGHLGFVKDKEAQSLLETEVQKKGWSNTWISGKVSDRRWSWFSSEYIKRIDLNPAISPCAVFRQSGHISKKNRSFSKNVHIFP